MGMSEPRYQPTIYQQTLVGRLLGFCIYNKLVVALGLALLVGAGIYVAPFDWELGGLRRNPVPVDAIPDIGENQQIVFTDWPGRSPQDIEDQITYPLSTAILGVPGVKTIRCNSMFGFSSIYVIFEEGREFYWTRSRLLEKLNSLPEGTLPEGVRPTLGPDATALGQIFWYTLEGRDPDGHPAGGWDLEELRTIQDWQVRQKLRSAEGVSETASVGGFVREYQVDVDPYAMRAFGVGLEEVVQAVGRSNIDVGAETIEVNRVEYLIRGVGFVKGLEDLANSVVKVTENVPVLVRHVATVSLGPQTRRGALDKGGAEAVGGVVVARYGANPLGVIKDVKRKIAELAPSLPTKVLIDDRSVATDEVGRFAAQRGFDAYVDGKLNQPAWLEFLRKTPRGEWPAWARTSQVAIVPFYDRTGLIYETLGTLNEALYQQVLIVVVVIVFMVMHLRSSLLISSVMPLAVLGCFIGMKVFGVDANIVALSGIAIAIGTLSDMGIIVCDNILRHLEEAPPDMPRAEVIHRAASEVGSAIVASVATTIISFIPIFFMTGPEGKLFKPLAFTKTFALACSIIVALTVLPPAAHILFTGRIRGRAVRTGLYLVMAAAGFVLAFKASWAIGLAVIAFGVYGLAKGVVPLRVARWAPLAANVVALAAVIALLSGDWEPLGPQRGFVRNLIFVAGLIGLLMACVMLFQRFYAPILRWCLAHKALFLSLPAAILVLGALSWLGFDRVFSFAAKAGSAVGIKESTTRSARFWVNASRAFPGLGREFMPPLEEGSFLFMPATMAHASIGEALDILHKQNLAMEGIPEIESVVGKIGRADSALDPAPISMIETVVNYKSEYLTDKDGKRLTFAVDESSGQFARDRGGRLIPDPSGQPYRQWRPRIRSPDDIWKEILAATEMPGVTAAPRLQPIAARIVMLQSGTRATMAARIKGPDLGVIEKTVLEIERMLRQVPGVEPYTVVADRIVGKRYGEFVQERSALARYGVAIGQFQDVVQVAVGGMGVTTTVEGRQRFPVRVRYQRELRDSIEAMGRILVGGSGGTQVPLEQLAEIRYVRGPEMIKSEDTSLVGYVLFDKQPGQAEVDVVERARGAIAEAEASGQFIRPAGVEIGFVGTYQNQLHASATLRILVPLSLLSIFIVLYFQFRAVSTTLMVFVGVMVAWAGAFLLLWLYGQRWFLDFAVMGVNLRELFHVRPVNLSVAVWVGFLALFGVADDDGVIMGTYLDQSFGRIKPATVAEVRAATVAGGQRRVRAALMTTVTTVLALLPVFTSTGKGSDIMVPMAIPSLGGMTIQVLTMLIVPVLYCAVRERKLTRSGAS
jgi:Cu(I)/Ag(I) efflux system membrane protein CusA/SilA